MAMPMGTTGHGAWEGVAAAAARGASRARRCLACPGRPGKEEEQEEEKLQPSPLALAWSHCLSMSVSVWACDPASTSPNASIVCACPSVCALAWRRLHP